jgi:hypothetical protein
MNQLEIQYFFPLTEQISLGLDYTDCDTKVYIFGGVMNDPGTTFFISPVTTPIWTTSINIDTNNIIITSKNKQPLYRRILFKLLGIKWKCET